MKRIEMVCLSDQPIGTNLHYWRGRSTPCNQTDCPACREGHTPRWKGYLFICPIKTRRVLIFEYTQRAHQEFTDQLAKRNTLRGLVFSAGRLGAKPNSPLQILMTDTVVDPTTLPNPEDLAEVLERMWEVRQQELPGFDVEQLTRTLTNGAPPR